MPTDHYLERHPYPGSGGDRPTPWEVTYTCGCGEELWTAEEGRSTTPGTPDEALQEHIEDLQLDALARRLNDEGWTCGHGSHEPGRYDGCDDCEAAARDLARFLTEAELVDLGAAA